VRNRELELELLLRSDESYTQGSYEEQLSKRKKAKGLVKVRAGC
jgi:hypothetical protein